MVQLIAWVSELMLMASKDEKQEKRVKRRAVGKIMMVIKKKSVEF